MASRPRGRARRPITAYRIAEGLTPTPERRTHGALTRAPRYLEQDGVTRVVWQGLDTTGIMLARGTISDAMKRAADLFHEYFQRAGLDALHGSDPARTPVRLTGLVLENRGADAARHQVLTALDALGGLSEPGGSCAWHVLGLEESLKAWVMRERWGNRPIDRVAASGILIADLGILKRHWGL